MNITNPTTFGTPGLTLTTENLPGTGNAIRTGASILVFDEELPDAITYSQSGAVGTSVTAAHRDHAHAMVAGTSLAAPALTLGTANSAGAAATAFATNSTILAFDATLPDAITFGQSGEAGSASVVSRRDHAHAMVAEPSVSVTVRQETRAAATASGSVIYEGADFVPTGVIVFSINNTSKDMITMGGAGSTTGAVYINDFQGTTAGGNTGLTLFAQDTVGSNRQYGAFDSFTSDGIQINWTKGGTGQECLFTIVYFR